MLAVIVIVACGALLAGGVALAVRWGGAPSGERAEGLRAVLVALAAGAVAGVLVAGAGGRLVMRMLALTSPDARGALTEAQATIGDITVEGTLGLLLFAGLPAGVLMGALYACIRFFLPAGRTAGALLGLLALVLAGATLEPLRADNIDFNLVGPDWLSVLAFTALALLQGMVLVAISQRFGAAPGGSRFLLRGRLVLAALALVALPTFADALQQILTA